MHDLDGALGVVDLLEFDGAGAERAAVFFVDLAVDDVAHFAPEEVLELGPFDLVGYVAHEYGLLPAVFEAGVAVASASSVVVVGAAVAVAVSARRSGTGSGARAVVVVVAVPVAAS